MNAETDETRVECSKESFAIHLQTSSIPRDATEPTIVLVVAQRLGAAGDCGARSIAPLSPSRSSHVSLARDGMAAFDQSAFAAAPPFSPTQWLNDALSAPAAANEPLELRLSVLLTKLQLSAADVDADVHRRCVELAALTTPVARELGLVSKQAAAVRTELATLLEEVGEIEERSEASVGTLRDVLAVRERFATAAHTLQQAERVAALMRTAEASFARGDAASAAGGVAQLGAALDALGAEELQRLFPDAASKVATLRGKLLDRLRPDVLEAVREHDSAAMLRLSGLFAGLGASGAVREVYVQCAQGPIFEQWNAARRASSARVAVQTLWSCVEGVVPAERAFVAAVFADDTALLPTLLSEALGEIGAQVEQTILDALPTAAGGLAGSDEAWSSEIARGSASPRFARVSMTFTRRGSARNPTPRAPPSLLRVAVNTTASFSRPWNPSTEEISSSLPRPRTAFRALLSARTCAEYGAMTPICDAVSSPPARSDATTVIAAETSSSFCHDCATATSLPSGTGTNATGDGDGSDGHGNPHGGTLAAARVPLRNLPP